MSNRVERQHNHEINNQEPRVISKQELLLQNQKLIDQFKRNHIFNKEGQFKTGIHQKTFKEGATYQGQLNNEGFREGKGLFKYKENEDIYFGDWKDDKFDGFGTYVFTKGDRYNGELKDGRKNGKGIYYYANGNMYDGNWFNDKKHGHGKFKYANTKEMYEGKNGFFIYKI